MRLARLSPSRTTEITEPITRTTVTAASLRPSRSHGPFRTRSGSASPQPSRSARYSSIGRARRPRGSRPKVPRRFAETNQPAVTAARVASVESPAFLASRGRTTPAEAGSVPPHSSDPGSGLWGFEGAPKRTVASVTVPAAGSSSSGSGTQAYTMARRGPTRPDWENPPRLDNYPRLRAHEDRNNNQPLLLAALGVAIVMVALVFIPLWTGKNGGGSNSSASPSLGASGASGAVAVATDTPSPSPSAVRTLCCTRSCRRTRA